MVDSPAVRIVDTFITADGRVTQDPALAVRLDRDVYDDAGQLIRREWYTTPPGGGAVRPWTEEERRILELIARDRGWEYTQWFAALILAQARALGEL